MIDHKFKKLSVGDLVVQEIRNTVIHPNKIHRRNGILIEIGKTVSVIEWTNSTEISENRYLTIFNTTLRKMIMDGHMAHYPVQTGT